MTERPKSGGIQRCEKQGACWRDPTSTVPLASAVERELNGLRTLYPILESLEVKISGCSNFCGFADVTMLIVGQDDLVNPNYRFSLRVHAGEGQWRQRWLSTALQPEQVLEAFTALVDLFLLESLPREPFQDTVDRLGPEIFAREIEDLFAGR